MIKITIDINGKVIGEISAVRLNNERLANYKTSNGYTLRHRRKSGALPLVKRMVGLLSEKDLSPEENKDTCPVCGHDIHENRPVGSGLVSFSNWIYCENPRCPMHGRMFTRELYPEYFDKNIDR
jgi:hypothetical protein